MQNKAAHDGKYIPALDGLRALAIIMVAAYHLDLPGAVMGWSGVHLFFVISGFLITGILLNNKDDAHYFRNFYGRRILRIFPIYYLTLLLMFLPFFSKDSGTGDGVYFFFYLQNFAYSAKNWMISFPQFFSHTWSLAIEEQFYLLWPFLVRFVQEKYLKYVIAGGFVMAIISRVCFVTFYPDKIALPYASLVSELDSLMCGACLAVLVRSKVIPRQRIAGWGGRVFIAGGVIILLSLVMQAVFFNAGVTWFMAILRLGLLTLLGVSFAGLVAYITQRETPVSLLLNLAPLRYLGKISYGVYLFHRVVFYMVDTLSASLWQPHVALPAGLLVIVKICLTLLLAHFSWVWIEKPILKLKDRFSYRSVIPQPVLQEPLQEKLS